MLRQRPPLIIAHRGASFNAPENTLAAFRLAWEQGADGIETDVRLTADGHIVCLHDEDTQRVDRARKTGLKVRNSTYNELKAIDVGLWKGPQWRGETIPTFDAVLSVVPDGKLAFVEIKTGPEIVEPLAELLESSSRDLCNIVLISFDERVIEACHQRLPTIRRDLLIEYEQQSNGAWTPTAAEVIARIRRTGADGLGTQNQPAHINEAFADELRQNGVNEFQVWTVDLPEQAQHYERLGAWALTTNRPKYIRGFLDSR